jgi:nucleotide-binding universal stress UspA family protein
LARATGVLTRPGSDTRGLGNRLLDDAAARAAHIGARALPALVDAESTAAGILDVARLHETDLVIIGANRTDVDGHLFLGHTVDRLLRNCQATMVVVIAPPDRD